MPKRFDQLDTKAVINDNDRIVILDSEDLIGGNPSVKTADVDAFKGDKGDQGDAGDLVATEGTPVNYAAEIKNAYSTNLTGENNDIVYTAKLDYDDVITVEYINPGSSVAEVKSSLSTDLVGDNNDVVYTSKLTGVAGDDITVAYLDPESESQSLDVVVVGTAIEVYLATNDQNGGEIISTADEIKAAITLVPAAHALVGTADKAGNDGSGVVTAMVATNLANGVDAVTYTLGVEVAANDITVNLATNTSGVITSTADEIKAAIALVPAAHALVGTADKADNDGSGVVTALTAATLVGGSAEVAATVGAKGTVRFDGSNVYVAVSANTWKKASLGTL